MSNYFAQSRPVGSLDRWDNSLAARGFTYPTGRTLPSVVKFATVGAVGCVALAIWVIRVALRLPDTGVGA